MEFNHRAPNRQFYKPIKNKDYDSNSRVNKENGPRGNDYQK